MAKKVTMIPATLDKNTSKPIGSAAIKRVAGYARVSTDNDDQVNSYEAQVDYYTEYIQNRADWIFVKVYTDDGISGTSTAKRTGFNTMIEDALAGKIDLIVTKSVSRFARNTVDSLSTIRKLKDNGIEVYFEKENIWTFDSSGELLLTIMSSISQEESRSISLNVTWGVRKGMQDGKVHIAFSSFLGYDRGPNGNLVINEEQAKSVRMIYAFYIQGLSLTGIANKLIELGVDTPTGNKTWRGSTVDRILKNEKYKGDALLQKTYTPNYLTKKKKVNQGEVPQYYVEGNHPAIIDPLVFDWVQKEYETRGAGYSGKHIFSTRFFCEECGSVYGRKLWHSKEACRAYVWQCIGKYPVDRDRLKGKRVEVCIPNPICEPADPLALSISTTDGEEGRADNLITAEEGMDGQKKARQAPKKIRGICSGPSIHEEDLEKAFIKAVNRLLQGRETAIAAFELAKATIFDTSALEIDLVSVNAEIRSIAMRMKMIGDANTNPDAYSLASDASVDTSDSSEDEVGVNYLDVTTTAENEARMAIRIRLEEAKQRQKELKKKIKDKGRRRVIVDEFLSKLKENRGRVEEFSPELFISLVDFATIKSTGKYARELSFTFLNGQEITVTV